MRRIFQLALLIVAVFGFTNCQKAKTDIYYKKKYLKEIKEARREAGFFMSRNFIPGGNAAIMKNGELIYSEGLGFASKDLEVPARRETKFRIGDLSEVFTTAIFRKLAAEGTVVPDSSIQAWVPDFPRKEKKITLDNLANEMAGFRAPRTADNCRTEVNRTLERGISSFKDEPLEFEPGTYQMPSIFNYNLLGLALEKATGKRYNELLQELTDTLHLDNTVIDHPLATVKNRSDFYELNMISQVVNGMFYDLRQNAPSEGILSTAEDLVKFGNALIKNDYFDNIRDTLFAPAKFSNDAVASQSNGWVVFTDGAGRRVYGRQGKVPGGSSSLLIYPDEELVVAFACNLTSSLDDTPVFLMAKPFFPETEESKDKSGPLK